MQKDFDTFTVTRPAVIGVGTMGASLVAVLGRSVPVVIVERDTQRAQHIRENGIVIHGLDEITAHPTIVSSIGELSRLPIDVVFVATKTTAIDQLSHELRPVLAEANRPIFVVSFQNGIEPGRALMEKLEHQLVLRMVLNYGAKTAPDGSVNLLFSHPPHAIGCLNPEFAPACDAIAKLLTRGGMETKFLSDIEPLVWAKGILNAAMNPVAALTNSSIGEVLDSPARQIVERLIDEALQIAAAERINLGPDIRARMWQILEEARPHTPSMVEDIRAGRETEVGQLNRQIVEHAKRIGHNAADHSLITALIDAFDWRVFHGRHE